MPRDNMRGVVVDAVRRLGEATIDRIREATGLARSTIKRHIAEAYKAGELQRFPLKEEGKGRDPYLYTVTK